MAATKFALLAGAEKVPQVDDLWFDAWKANLEEIVLPFAKMKPQFYQEEGTAFVLMMYNVDYTAYMIQAICASEDQARRLITPAMAAAAYPWVIAVVGENAGLIGFVE
jgi:hypothetical protein